MHMLVIRTGWSGALRPTPDWGVFSSYGSSIVFSKIYNLHTSHHANAKRGGERKNTDEYVLQLQKTKQKKSYQKQSDLRFHFDQA